MRSQCYILGLSLLLVGIINQMSFAEKLPNYGVWRSIAPFEKRKI